MGVGMGFAIGASVLYPNKKVVAVEGDSAFGFSGMEIEVSASLLSLLLSTSPEG